MTDKRPGETCRKVLLHRERLARLREEYSFDDAAADRAVRIIESHFFHWKAPHAGKPFLLAPWQRNDVVRPLFGLKRLECECGGRHRGPLGKAPKCPECGKRLRPERARRLFREAYIQIGRKNGKTALAATILLVIMLTDGEGLELYTAATKKEQARIVFDDACKFIRKSPELKKRLRIYKTKIEYTRRNCILKALSSDENSLDGLNTSAAVIDELHAHPTAHVHDVIATSTGAREQPLLLNITTAGKGEHGVCHDLYEYSEKVLEGLIRDDGWFAFIAEADKELRWDDPLAFRQANPNFGVSIQPEYLERELRKAKDQPSYRSTFERYHLNRWIAQAGEKWLPVEKWKAAAANFREADMAGHACFAGLDLASVSDTAAFAMVFPWLGGVRLAVRYWIPEATLEERVSRDKVPYDLWAEAGWIRTCAGDVIDYGQVRDDILELAGRLKIRRVAYDDWNATHLTQELAKAKLDMVNFIQGTRSFHAPATELERLLLGGLLWHDGNPVTAWMASNIRVSRDSSDKIKPVREPKRNIRIDGIVAAIMGIDCFMRDVPVQPLNGDAFLGMRRRLGI